MLNPGAALAWLLLRHGWVAHRYRIAHRAPARARGSIQRGGYMGHDKSRSGVSVGTVDWNDPRLGSLLEKADGWRLDNRSHLPPQEVQVHINSDWTASTVSKPALVVAKDGEVMVLVTRFPIPHGEHVRVDSPRDGDVHIVWGKVIEGREGHRAEDHEHGLFLIWLRFD
jgi:hypothetical protein